MASTNYTQLLSKSEDYKLKVDDVQNKYNVWNKAVREYSQSTDTLQKLEDDFKKRDDSLTSIKKELDNLNESKDKMIERISELHEQLSAKVIELNQFKTSYDEKKQEIVDIKNSVGIGLTEIGLLHDRSLKLTQRDELNESLISLRMVEDELEIALNTKKQDLDKLKALFGATDPTNAAIVSKEAEVETAKLALEAKVLEVKNKLDEIKTVNEEILILDNNISASIKDIRIKEDELKIISDQKESKINDITIKVDEIDGLCGYNDYSIPYIDTPPPLPLVFESTSSIGIIKLMIDNLDLIKNSIQDIVENLETKRQAAKIVLDQKSVELTQAINDLSQNETQLRAIRDELNYLIDRQRDIEVDAAAALLEDFLKKRTSIIESGAPTISNIVDTQISYTYDSSKVRTLKSRINAAFSNPDDYIALQNEFAANPVESFFYPIVNDPSFSFLSQPEVDSLDNQIKLIFGKKASTLFHKYVGGVSDQEVKNAYWFIVAVILIALLAVALVYISRK